jgi:hypothetical protein
MFDMFSDIRLGTFEPFHFCATVSKLLHKMVFEIFWKPHISVHKFILENKMDAMTVNMSRSEWGMRHLVTPSRFLNDVFESCRDGPTFRTRLNLCREDHAHAHAHAILISPWLWLARRWSRCGIMLVLSWVNFKVLWPRPWLWVRRVTDWPVCN